MSTLSRLNDPHRLTRRVFEQMRSRCNNPNHMAYPRYGALGVTVCERWSRFHNFLEDMGSRPSKAHSIDRIDNNGGYEPDNCRWATAQEQTANRDVTVWLEYEGRRQTLSAWSRETGLAYTTLLCRLKKGLDPSQVLEPVKEHLKRAGRKPPLPDITFRGETKSLREWSRELDYPYPTLWDRLTRQNLPPEIALAMPIRGGGWAKKAS